MSELRPTIKSISERAGVSTYAVSQALAGKPGVAADTRERILAIARGLGYVANGVAANLRQSETRTVGVLTASGRNQYYSMLVQAIDGVLQSSGYHALTNDTMRAGTYDAELERESVDELLRQRVAAVVATYSLTADSYHKLQQWETPVVFVDSLPPAHAAQAPFVGADNYRASQLVVEHLHSLGLRHILMLAYPREWNTREPRERGFKRTAARLGLEATVIESANSAEAAFDVLSDYLARGLASGNVPDAIYAANTPLLQGTLTALRRARLKVPRDVSVVGFDDFDWAELLDPPITVVDQHIDVIGTKAGETVLELVQERREHAPLGGAEKHIHVQVEPTLVLRRSCAAKQETPRRARRAR